jgi:hypothetical protein
MATTKKSTAASVRDRVTHSRNEVFVADDFTGPRLAVQRELSRLAAAGDLRHLRNGIYWRGVETPLGMTPARGEQIVCKLTGSRAAVGPAGWSAALELGLSTQHPNREIIAAPRRITGDLPRIEIKDRSRREERRLQRLNRTEVAILEVLEDWDRVVETSSDSAVQRLSKWLGSDEVRIEKLVRASKTEPATVRENLRALLLVSGYEHEAGRVRPSTVMPKLAAELAMA